LFKAGPTQHVRWKREWPRLDVTVEIERAISDGLLSAVEGQRTSPALSSTGLILMNTAPSSLEEQSRQTRKKPHGMINVRRPAPAK